MFLLEFDPSALEAALLDIDNAAEETCHAIREAFITAAGTQAKEDAPKDTHFLEEHIKWFDDREKEEALLGTFGEFRHHRTGEPVAYDIIQEFHAFPYGGGTVPHFQSGDYEYKNPTTPGTKPHYILDAMLDQIAYWAEHVGREAALHFHIS